MFSDLYIQIYVMPWYELFCLCFVALIVFRELRKRCRTRWFWRPCLAAILLTWAGVVLYATILSRQAGIESVWAVVPFHSYREVLSGGDPELLRSNLMNAVLFAPAGLLTGALLPDRWPMKRRLLWASGIFCLFSLGIELTQYHLAIGQAEIDDVIHNTLGALIGCLVCVIEYDRHFEKRILCTDEENGTAAPEEMGTDGHCLPGKDETVV